MVSASLRFSAAQPWYAETIVCSFCSFSPRDVLSISDRYFMDRAVGSILEAFGMPKSMRGISRAGKKSVQT